MCTLYARVMIRENFAIWHGFQEIKNTADGLTKELVKDSHPLWKLMTTNKLDVDPIGWIKGSSKKI